MRFLCDYMLLGVAHWLRVAGYDTACAQKEQPDRDVLAWALAEDRILLTCDRDLLEFRDRGQRLLYMQTNQIERCAPLLVREFGVDWLHAPLTRCLKCNLALEAANDDQRAVVPPEALAHGTEVSTCVGCGKVFWGGSHADRMRGKLRAFAARSA